MKKTRVVASIAAGLAGMGLGLGLAQAASSVTMYGVADAGPMYNQYSYSGAGQRVRQSSTGLQTGIMNSSRLGLKGSEDLGGGLKAIFQFEQKVKLTDGGSDSKPWKRQAWVGLDGRWGTFTLGRQKDIADNMLKIDAMRGLGKVKRAFGAKGGRHDGLLKYTSPTFGGARGGVAYAHGDSGDDYSNYWSLGAQYKGGPLLLAGSYNVNQLRAGYSVRNWALGGAYDFKVAKLLAGYGQDRNGKLNTPGDAGAGNLGGFSPAGLGDYDSEGFRSRNYYLGAVVPAGTGEFAAAWLHSSSNLDQVSPAAAKGTQDILALQYKHFMSKRTFLYAYGAYGRNLAYVKDFNGRQLAVGLQHNF